VYLLEEDNRQSILHFIAGFQMDHTLVRPIVLTFRTILYSHSHLLILYSIEVLLLEPGVPGILVVVRGKSSVLGLSIAYTVASLSEPAVQHLVDSFCKPVLLYNLPAATIYKSEIFLNRTCLESYYVQNLCCL